MLVKALGVEVPPDRRGVAGFGSMAETLDAIEGALSQGEYLADGRFSAADLYLGAHLGWGMGFGTIEKRPAFERYWDRLRTRPAAIRAAEIDDALVAAQNEGKVA